MTLRRWRIAAGESSGIGNLRAVEPRLSYAPPGWGAEESEHCDEGRLRVHRRVYGGGQRPSFGCRVVGARCLGSSLLGMASSAHAELGLPPAPVTITVDSPQSGEVVKNRVTMAPVRGRAASGSGAVTDFDVMLAIDVSHSARFPSGIDVDQGWRDRLQPEAGARSAGHVSG